MIIQDSYRMLKHYCVVENDYKREKYAEDKIFYHYTQFLIYH